MKRIFGAVLALLFAAAAVIGFSTPAHAGTITGAITGVTVETETVTSGSTVKLGLSWAVPDGSKPGDTFTLTLPPELRTAGSGFELKDSSGATVAHATYNGQTVIFTLTEYAETHTGVKGGAAFSTTWSSDARPGEVVPLTVEFDGQVVRGSVTVSGPTGGSETLRKTGAFVDQDQSGDLRWSVRTPSLTTGDTVVCVDTAASGHTYKPGTLTAFSESWTGTWYGERAGHGFKVTSENPLTVETTFEGNTGRVFGFSYETAVSADQDAYRNSVRCTIAGQPVEVSSGVIRADGTGWGGGDIPTVDPTPEPTVDPTPEPTVDPTPDPVVEPLVELTPEPVVEPTVDPVTKPVAAPDPAETPIGHLADTGAGWVIPAGLLASLGIIAGAAIIARRNARA